MHSGPPERATIRLLRFCNERQARRCLDDHNCDGVVVFAVGVDGDVDEVEVPHHGSCWNCWKGRKEAPVLTRQ